MLHVSIAILYLQNGDHNMASPLYIVAFYNRILVNYIHDNIRPESKASISPQSHAARNEYLWYSPIDCHIICNDACTTRLGSSRCPRKRYHMCHPRFLHPDGIYRTPLQRISIHLLPPPHPIWSQPSSILPKDWTLLSPCIVTVSPWIGDYGC